MKLYFIFLVFINVFIVGSAISQHTSCTETMDYENATHYYQGNELWINDTINYYAGNNENWVPTRRLIVLSRDGLGQEMQTVLEKYNETTNIWEAKIKNQREYYYFQDTNFIKENKTLVWHDASKKWQTQSLKNYNKSGQLVEEIAMDWTTDQLKPKSGSRIEYTYGQQEDLLIKEIEDWNVATESWNNSSRISTYDDKKNYALIEDIEKWDVERNSWVLSQKTVTRKDVLGQVLKQESTHFSNAGKSVVMVNSLRNEYDHRGFLRESYTVKDLGYRKTGVREQNLYDSAGKRIKTTRFLLDASKDFWEPVEEKRFSYNGNVEQTLYRNWDSDSESWSNANLESRQYQGDLLLEKKVQKWIDAEENWLPVSMEQYSYLNENLIEKLDMKWNSQMQGWNNVSRIEATYSSAGKTNEVKELWNEEHADWQGVFQHVWEYDASGNITRFEWMQFSDDTWVLKERADFGWHMFSLSKTECKENYTIEVFPNPTKGVLHIKSTAGTLSRIAILDQAGQLIEAISLDQASTTIDISHLPSGNYFIECNTSIQTNTFKVVKL